MLTCESPMLCTAKSGVPLIVVYWSNRSAVAPAGSGIAGLPIKVPRAARKTGVSVQRAALSSQHVR